MASNPFLPEAALSNDGWCISVKQGDDQRDASEGPSRTHYTLCSFCGLIKSSLPPWWAISSLVVSLSFRQSCHSRKGICADVVLSELIRFLVTHYHSMDPTLQMRQFPRPYECPSSRLSSPCSTTSISFSKQPRNSCLCFGYTKPATKDNFVLLLQFCFRYTTFTVLVTQARHNTQYCAYTWFIDRSNEGDCVY